MISSGTKKYTGNSLAKDCTAQSVPLEVLSRHGNSIHLNFEVFFFFSCFRPLECYEKKLKMQLVFIGCLRD